MKPYLRPDVLYRFLKVLLRFLVHVFFRRIHVEHADRVPASGPVIIAANHPNTMMDPLLVALLSGRSPYFLGKSTLFMSRIARWFFNSVHVIPVYRQDDAANEMDKNEDSFRRCYEALEKNKALVIMPEGISQMDGTLHQIKTGTARIGFGAEMRNNFKLGVTIIPAGINYSDPTKFYSDVHCRFGRPIHLNEYKSTFEMDEYEAVYQVTDQIKEALEKLTTTVKAPETAMVFEHLSQIYKKDIALEQGLELDSLSHEFAITRGIADAINWFYEHYPERYRQLDAQLTAYLAKLEGLELRDDLLTTAEGQRTFFRRASGLFGVILGFPFYLWGLLNNFLPYNVPRYVLSKVNFSIEYQSTVKFISGFVAYLASYSIQTYLVWLLTHSGSWTMVYLLSLIPAGRFTLYYRDRMQGYRQHLRIFSLFLKRKTLIFDIIQERLELIQALDEAKHMFMSRDLSEKKAGSDAGKE